MIRIRQRNWHDITADVSNEQTPKWFIGLDGTTYGKDQWELLPPPGEWENITAQVILEAPDSPAQGRVNFYFHEAASHAVRIGYLQFKGHYRLVMQDGRLMVQQRKDTE